MLEEQVLVFDEDACAEFIFNKLIEKGVAVSIDDIRLIMELEYQYGVNVGIYPSTNEEG